MSLLDNDENLMSESDLIVCKQYMKQINTNVIIRTIHPVGQGAFYSERFIDKEENSQYLMVYDCGSSSPKKLQNEISSSIRQGETINVLFISHFDRDHVNGLAHLMNRCTIKKVVMPLISPTDRWFYLLDLPSSLYDIILNPQAFFDGANIVYVNSITEDETAVVDEPININESSLTTIASGTKLFSSCIADWCYIPFNFDEANRRNLLKANLFEYNIDITSLEGCDLKYITENREIIKKAYQKVCVDGANKTSLILYSGPTLKRLVCKWWSRNIWSRCCEEMIDNAACLYLGDTDLNQQRKNNSILYDLYFAFGDIGRNIGTIQLPHHGSIKNFNKDVLSMWNYPKSYFASFGDKNQFGHPSTEVLEYIMQESSFYGVTENRSSIAMEIIYLDI